MKRGGTLLDKHQVVEIVPGQTVTVVTNKGSFLTKRLVIAAGAWSPSLCRTLGINLPLKVSHLQYKIFYRFLLDVRINYIVSASASILMLKIKFETPPPYI